jgi:hypothetical protein
MFGIRDIPAVYINLYRKPHLRRKLERRWCNNVDEKPQQRSASVRGAEGEVIRVFGWFPPPYYNLKQCPIQEPTSSRPIIFWLHSIYVLIHQNQLPLPSNTYMPFLGYILLLHIGNDRVGARDPQIDRGAKHMGSLHDMIQSKDSDHC